MKILVEGKLDKLKEVKFECPRCGCVFMANEMEYRVRYGCVFMANEMEYYVIDTDEGGNGHHIFMCECPCCKMEVLIDDAR